jgi:hypothetical protein
VALLWPGPFRMWNLSQCMNLICHFRWWHYLHTACDVWRWWLQLTMKTVISCDMMWCHVVYRQLPDYTAPHHRIQQSSWYWVLRIMDILKLRHLTSFFFSVDVSYSQTGTWVQPATKAHFTLHCVTMSHHWKTNINLTGKDKLAENKLITGISYLSSLYPVFMVSNMHWREKNKVDSDISSVRKTIGI